MFNYLNHSHTTTQDDWVFFSDYENDSGIYAQKKNSKQKTLLITDADEGSQVSVAGNAIYYYSDNKIMKYHLKTKEITAVVDEPSSYFIVAKDEIYYLPQNKPHQLFSISAEGTDKKLITSDVYSYMFAYHQDSIYFVNPDHQFVSVSLADLQPAILGENVNPVMSMIGKDFYFLDFEGHIVRYSIDESSWTTVIPKAKEMYKKIVFFDEDTIFYSFHDPSISYKYTISANSTVEYKDMNIFELHYPNVIDGKHYYYNGPIPFHPKAKRETL